MLQCPYLVPSATVTAMIFADVKASLQLQDCEVRVYPPDSDNIYLRGCQTQLTDAGKGRVMVDISCTRNAFPKTVVYARSINCVTDVYAWLLENLQQDAYVNDQRMVAMYHAHLSDDMLYSTMADFKKPDLTVRVVVSTVAFGVGIKIPDIRQVVHNRRQCLIRLPCIFTALVYAEKNYICDPKNPPKYAIWRSKT